METREERRLLLRGSAERHSEHKEQFQKAWLRAIAASAGCNVLSAAFDDGLDAMLEHRHALHSSVPERRALLRIQLKATELPPSSGSITVKVKRHRLAEYAVVEPHVSTILVALHLPAESYDWIRMTNWCMALRGKSCWVNLAGRDVSVGDPNSKLAVRVPVEQGFSDVALARIMQRIGQGGQP